MPDAIAFLRAINVGGRRITNDELVGHFVDMGFPEVSAYQAAGNVLFGSAGSADVEAVIERGLSDRLGYDVPTFVRTAHEVRAVAGTAPFTADEMAETAGRVQVALLRTLPDPDRVSEVVASAPDEDRLRVVGRELFWLPRQGLSDSALDVNGVERAIGPMTIRTLGTISRIAGKLD